MILGGGKSALNRQSSASYEATSVTQSLAMNVISSIFENDVEESRPILDEKEWQGFCPFNQDNQ